MNRREGWEGRRGRCQGHVNEMSRRELVQSEVRKVSHLDIVKDVVRSLCLLAERVPVFALANEPGRRERGARRGTRDVRRLGVVTALTDKHDVKNFKESSACNHHE